MLLSGELWWSEFIFLQSFFIVLAVAEGGPKLSDHLLFLFVISRRFNLAVVSPPLCMSDKTVPQILRTKGEYI